MLDRETCREHILSEDYRDFIGNHVRTPFFNSLMNVHRCEQEAGFSYKCFYLPKEISDPITLPKYSYASIPNCYSPLNMQTTKPESSLFKTTLRFSLKDAIF